MIFSIYIINKAGGLVYNKDYSEGLSKLTSNEYLVLAGTFHGYGLVNWSRTVGNVKEYFLVFFCKRLSNYFEPICSVHAITSKISPVPGSSGIEMLETDSFRIHCFQTLTGTYLQNELYIYISDL